MTALRECLRPQKMMASEPCELTSSARSPPSPCVSQASCRRTRLPPKRRWRGSSSRASTSGRRSSTGMHRRGRPGEERRSWPSSNRSAQLALLAQSPPHPFILHISELPPDASNPTVCLPRWGESDPQADVWSIGRAGDGLTRQTQRTVADLSRLLPLASTTVWMLCRAVSWRACCASLMQS